MLRPGGNRRHPDARVIESPFTLRHRTALFTEKKEQRVAIVPRPLQDAHYLTDLIVAKRDLGIIRGQAAPQFRGVDQKRGDVFQVFRLEARSVPLGMRSVRLVRGEVSKKRTTIPVPDEIFHPGKIKVAIFTLGRVLSHHGQPRVKRIGARRTKMFFARTQGAVAQRLEVRGQGPCTFLTTEWLG